MTDKQASLISPEIVAELQPALMKYARRLHARQEDADDLMQEMWASALKTAPTFEQRSSLGTWLRAIMRRRFVDHCRRTRLLAELDESNHEQPQELAAERLDRLRAARRASDALAGLSEQEQRAMALVHLEDLERDEAAARLNVTGGHLRVILFRARQKLGDALHEQGVDAELVA
jgi:RNA polymerase sigma-70 factor (ECF subfamily)